MSDDIHNLIETIIHHTDPDLSQKANLTKTRQSLAPFNDHLVIGRLISALQHPNWVIRQKSAELLAEKNWHPQTESEQLWFAFASLNFVVLINQKAVGFLIPLLQSEDNMTCGMVADILGDIGDVQAVEPILALLKHPNQYARMRGASALGAIGDVRAVEPILALLKNGDIDSRVIIALGQLRDIRALDHLTPLLNHPDEAIRLAVIEAFREMKAIQTTEHLIPLLKDTHPAIRREALRALANVGINNITALLKNEDWHIRRMASVKLGDMGKGDVIEHLIPLLNDKSYYVRSDVAKALRKIGTPEAQKALREAGLEE